MATELPVTRSRGVCCALPEVDERWAESTSELLKVLADPTRLTIVASLWKAGAPVCVCDFTSSLDLSQPTISHHMAKLRAAGLVEAEKRGLWIHYRLRETLPAPARSLIAQLVAAA